MDHRGEIIEAREAFEYWSGRARRLPWHRRAARREAREMAARWRARLVARHLERWRESLVVPLLHTGGRTGSAHIRSLAFRSARRTAIGRRIMFVCSFVVCATAASFVLLLAIAAHLAGV
jgi:hypothetical protein